MKRKNNNKLKIVGSRSGGHEYKVRFASGAEIWMGQKVNSDFDIVLDGGEKPPPLARCEILPDYFKYISFPYIENNTFYPAKDFKYLLFSAALKLSFLQTNTHLLFSHKKLATVFDINGNVVDKIVFDINCAPSVALMRASKMLNFINCESFFYTENFQKCLYLENKKILSFNKRRMEKSIKQLA